MQTCKDGGVETAVWNGNTAWLEWADAAVVSWWNHPAMARFLYELPTLSAPLILWSHVNGYHYPCLPFRLADAFDKVLFTSPYSLENPAWTNEERFLMQKQAKIVYGIGQFYPQQMIPKENYENREVFTAGYVGTLNYGKLHPHFVRYCQEVQRRIPTVQFVLAGDRDAKLERDIRLARMSDCFTFSGFVSDVPALLRTFDAFSYLLQPLHYGTTENALLEAMACGLPVVAVRQNVEQYIVPPFAGYLVEDARQYGEVMEFLWKNPSRRKLLGRRAREYVQRTYCTEDNAAVFHDACQSAQSARTRPKHSFSFLGETPWQWFLFCAGEENRQMFEEILIGLRSGNHSEQVRARERLFACPPIFREERKSSLRHFAAAYPEDQSLQMIRKELEQE